MKNSMRKIKIIMLICSFFLLSSCGEETLSEEDLVDGRTIGAEQGVEDVEAGNFPFFGKLRIKEKEIFIHCLN